MLKELLKEVIVLIVGKQAESIADLLEAKAHVNEFTIAKKLDLTINQTRNILYKISNYGLVSSVRKKDKKKGWYTYFWKFEILKCLEFLRELLLKNIDDIEKQILERQQKVFYLCERCNLEVGEEEALILDFTCNECGDIFKVKDNSKLIKELEKNLFKLRGELEVVDKEMEKEKGVLEKKRNVELKKIQKEKEDKKAETAAKRRATKKKTDKEIIKKKSVKKKVMRPKTKSLASPLKQGRKKK